MPLPLPHDPPTRPARRRALGALGIALARRGVLANLALGIAAITVVVAFAATFVVARGGPNAPIERVPAVTASALAWGAGVLLAFAASVHAFRRDREDGIPALLRARGAAFGAYAWSRAYGLTLLLLIVVAGGTLASGLCATLVASRAGAAMRVAQGALAAFVYATAFAFTLGPLAVATLGNRSRAGGYFWLLMVLALPELLAPVTEGLVPPGFSELVSIPGALDALRAALMPPRLEPWRAVKALFVLTLVAFACAAVILRAARESQREEAAR